MALFDLPSHPDYFDPTSFDPKAIGFSVQRNYPPNIPFKPTTTRRGADDTVALLKIFVDPEKQQFRNNIPLRATATPFSRFRQDHIGTGYDHPDCPTDE